MSMSSPHTIIMLLKKSLGGLEGRALSEVDLALVRIVVADNHVSTAYTYITKAACTHRLCGLKKHMPRSACRVEDSQ